MRGQTGEFVQKFLKEKQIGGKVLDVGSLDINGTIKELFEKHGLEYAGIDMRKGPNVGLVLNAHDIKDKLDENSFDVVCCFDTLEHDDKFWITLENMRWVLKEGGYLLIAVPGSGCPKHDYPQDYWRFMENGVESFFEGMTDFYIEVQKDDPSHVEFDEIYGWAKK